MLFAIYVKCSIVLCDWPKKSKCILVFLAANNNRNVKNGSCKCLFSGRSICKHMYPCGMCKRHQIAEFVIDCFKSPVIIDINLGVTVANHAMMMIKRSSKKFIS